MKRWSVTVWIVGFCGCSGAAATGGGGSVTVDIAGTDIAVQSADVDVQSAPGTDATTAKIPSDVADVAPPTDCVECLSDDDCSSGWYCAQFQGSSFCAQDCNKATCATGHACTVAASAAGDQQMVCVPLVNPCGITSGGLDAGTSDTGGQTDVNSLVCGSLNGPNVPSCCVCAGKSCDPNGCFGGWFCNTPTCKCHPAPDPSTCGPDDAGSTVDAGSNDTSVSWPDIVGVQSINPGGGTLSALDFGIVGDTRPPNKDDLSGYPTAVITKIFQDVQAQNPPLPFVITTGDYQFSSPASNSAAAQFDVYLQAQANYTGTVFHTMGNHECTGAVVSNCGVGNSDGMTQTYKTFLQKLMAPLGVTDPWYVVNIAAADKSWTAKFVFIAANAWSDAQATWLDAAMAKPTTYTFVVRHEGVMVTDAPGVSPSATIIAKYPFTLLLVGHTHTFDYYASDREVITGNGGAPLATGVNYGYTIVRQRADKAIQVTAYDYDTLALTQQFVVTPAGAPTK